VKTINLDSYLTVEKGEIVIKLDREIIEEITPNFGQISPTLLTNLRCYFLTQKHTNYPLIFITYYQKDAIIKTVIDTHITNQLYSQYLPKADLLKKINLIHHFLVEYVLGKMRISGRLNFNISLIAGIIAVIIVMITIALNWAKFISLNPLFFILPVLMWGLLQEGIKRIIPLVLPKIQRLFWRYLLLNKSRLNEKITKFVLKNIKK